MLINAIRSPAAIYGCAIAQADAVPTQIVSTSTSTNAVGSTRVQRAHVMLMALHLRGRGVLLRVQSTPHKAVAMGWQWTTAAAQCNIRGIVKLVNLLFVYDWTV